MARRALPMRMHDVAASQSLDRILLLAAFLIGTTGSIALKLLATGPFLSAGFAALVLCAYAILTYMGTHLRLEPEAIGDNCYYLGFLFTLTSLSVTLYFVVQAGSAEQSDLIPSVISGFGVALSSTIVGVFLRVLLMQFRTDIVVREKEARLELDRMARSLRDEMSRGVRQMKLFTVETLQQAKEREAAFNNRSDLIFAETSEQMRQFVEKMTSIVQTTTNDMVARSLTSLSHDVEQASISMREMIESSTKEAIEASRQNFAAIHSEQEPVYRSSAALGEELTRVSDALTKMTGTITAHSEAMTERMEKAADSLVAQCDAVAEQLSRTAEKIGETGNRIAMAGQAAEGNRDRRSTEDA